MAEQDPSMTIILLEIVVAQTILIVGYIVYTIIRKRKRSALLKKIIIDAYENMGSRKEMLATGLAGLSTDKYESFAASLSQHEVDLYEYIVNTIHSNKNQDLQELKNAIDGLFKPYSGESDSQQAPAAESPGELSKEEPIIPNVDQAIDDLLGETEQEPVIDIEEDASPELDLSDDGGIAEIPDDLLEINTGDETEK